MEPDNELIVLSSIPTTFKISFKRHFYAAHRLAPPYEGKCGNIHGHNYQVTVEIEAEELGATGMVAEFDQVKAVIDLFDHTLILWGEDPLYEQIYDLGLSIMPVPVNPTTEALAPHLAKMILDNILESNQSIIWVSVHLAENEHISSDGWAFNSKDAEIEE